MNFIDIAVLIILAITILSGIYRGAFETFLNFCSTVASLLLGLILSPLISGAFKANTELYNTLLYYTEGSEYVAKTSVELTRTPVTQLTSSELQEIIVTADMPLPMGRCVTKNIASEAFASKNITTVGDYFNHTIVAVVTNIISILLVFLILRIILGITIRSVNYARHGFPVLTRNDSLVGGCIGVMEGLLFLFIIFMLLPLVLTVLPKIYEYVEESWFGDFFYRANLLLYLVSPT